MLVGCDENDTSLSAEAKNQYPKMDTNLILERMTLVPRTVATCDIRINNNAKTMQT